MTDAAMQHKIDDAKPVGERVENVTGDSKFSKLNAALITYLLTYLLTSLLTYLLTYLLHTAQSFLRS
jgi:hypothetical protein